MFRVPKRSGIAIPLDKRDTAALGQLGPLQRVNVHQKGRHWTTIRTADRNRAYASITVGKPLPFRGMQVGLVQIGKCDGDWWIDSNREIRFQ